MYPKEFKEALDDRVLPLGSSTILIHYDFMQRCCLLNSTWVSPFRHTFIVTTYKVSTQGETISSNRTTEFKLQ